MSMRNIYRKIARKNKTTVEEVKREMKYAIDEAYKNTPNNGITSAYQNQVNKKGEIPTPDELIKYAVKKIKNSLYNALFYCHIIFCESFGLCDFTKVKIAIVDKLNECMV